MAKTIQTKREVRTVTGNIVRFPTIVTQARDWEQAHKPFDQITKLPLFQFMVQEGPETCASLVPLKDKATGLAAMDRRVELLPHALDQLLSRIGFDKRTYEKLPPMLNLSIVNYLIQNYLAGTGDTMLRIQDDNKVRALMSGQFEPFDKLELYTLLEPFCKDADVRWYHDDDMTAHVSLTWPTTQEVIAKGDVVQRGIHISNSEVGVRSVTIASLVYKLDCNNGMIGGGEGGGIRRFRHTGDGSNLRDHVKAAIDETFLEGTKVIEQFKAAVNKSIADPFEYLTNVAKNKDYDMTPDEFKASMNAYMGAPNPSLYGVVNAVTKAAQEFKGEARYDMERLGVKLLGAGLRN